MKKFKVIVAVALATMTLTAMAGGVANAAVKKITKAPAAPTVNVSIPAPTYYAPAYYGFTYSSFGAIR